jgi:Mn2+/Fe2+ NRAMP family transporter
MKKLVEILLGVVTGIGGFLEVGSLATAAQAGAVFSYRLAWAVALGTVALAFLVEMSGRMAAVSGHTLAAAIRERFGIRYFVVPLVVVLAVSFMVLASEIGGVSLALQMATGIAFPWWALPVALAAWLALWKGTFGIVEKSAGLLGLVSVVFGVAAWRLHPDWGRLAASLVPSGAPGQAPRYWFGAVSILGASISPYLYFFYSSGVIEDEWDPGYVGVNRVIAGAGMAFGGVFALAVLVVAAHVFHPADIHVGRYEEMAMLLSHPLGRWGFLLFVLTLGITCFGAVTEIALSAGYLLAQGLGWKWSENAPPARAARFATTYTLLLFLAGALMAAGTDPLKLTNLSMAATAASLPVSVFPLLVVMNDKELLGEHRNGWISNTALVLLTLLSVVLLVVSVPLVFLGSGG